MVALEWPRWQQTSRVRHAMTHALVLAVVLAAHAALGLALMPAPAPLEMPTPIVWMSARTLIETPPVSVATPAPKPAVQKPAVQKPAAPKPAVPKPVVPLKPRPVAQNKPVPLKPLQPPLAASAPVAAAPAEMAPVAPSPAAVLTPVQFDAAYLQNPPPAYPVLSRRRREQGKVLLRVDVSAAGRASLVALHQSSGFPRLDDAAIAAVKGWRFVPARKDKDNVAASVVVPIVFDLN